MLYIYSNNYFRVGIKNFGCILIEIIDIKKVNREVKLFLFFIIVFLIIWEERVKLEYFKIGSYKISKF